uniref:Uncharacterized protein n=1 Tax=Triticum urartu TaxID=4572 RepID=A0A8R7TKK9_TRIUA
MDILWKIEREVSKHPHFAYISTNDVPTCTSHSMPLRSIYLCTHLPDSSAPKLAQAERTVERTTLSGFTPDVCIPLNSSNASLGSLQWTKPLIMTVQDTMSLTKSLSNTRLARSNFSHLTYISSKAFPTMSSSPLSLLRHRPCTAFPACTAPSLPHATSALANVPSLGATSISPNTARASANLRPLTNADTRAVQDTTSRPAISSNTLLASPHSPHAP